MANIVYIATSIDGYIADRNNGLDWLQMVPNPDKLDLGFGEFINGIDALVMGRNTFETVVGFGGEWPYIKPVFVYSRSLKNIPEELTGKVEIIQGSPDEITDNLKERGYSNLYIDGGQTIQGFLEADLIDELIITRIPILLGAGIPLFGELSEHLEFEHVSTEILLDELVATRYRRKF